MRIAPHGLAHPVLTGVTACVAAVLTAPVATPAQDDARASALERAALVETGLSRPVAIRGEPNPGMRLVDRMASYSVPGLSLAVIENGEVLWTKGFGLVEAGTEARVTAGTLFQIASISKSIAAFATLRLVDQGVLGLDDRIDERLKSWKVPENEFTRQRPVTLRQVLCHGAGFNVGGVDCYWPGEPLPTLLEVLTGTGAGVREAVAVQSLPGTAWRYSGGGYTVLEQLLRDVTGRSFADLAQELVLAPLEMRNTFYEQPLSADHARAAAVGHRTDGQPYPGKWRVFPTLCPGGAWSTAEDTARFACEILGALEGRSPLLSQSLAREMSRPHIASWGLGLQLQGQGRSSCFLHSGHNDGYICIMVAYPSTRQGAVVLTNGDGGEGLCFEVLRSIASAYDWPGYRVVERSGIALEPELFPWLIGSYALTADTTISISATGDELFALLPPVSDKPLPLFRETATRYFVLEDLVTIDFLGSDEGPATEAFVTAPGNQFHARRLDR